MSTTLDLFPEESLGKTETQQKTPPQNSAEKESSHSKDGARQKSRSAYKTISEVSQEVGVASHVLRFWETKFTQVKPTKRSGGRRYYNGADVDTLKKIRSLLYDEGYTIKGVQAYLKRGGASDIVAPSVGNTSDTAFYRHALGELQDIRDVLKKAQ